MLLSTVSWGDLSGKPLVALHGGNGTRMQWERMAKQGMPQRHWICPDLRGHGSSSVGPPWTVAQLADDVVETVSSLGIDTFDIVGHSLGGRIAAEVARRIPRRTRSLMLLDPPAMTRDEWAAHCVRSRTRTRSFESIEQVLTANTSAISPDARSHAERELSAALERTADGRLQLRTDRRMIEAVTDDIALELPYSLGNFAGPVLLLIAGIQYGVTRHGLEDLQAQLGQRLEAVTFEGAGHNLHWDAFDHTVVAMCNFLAKLDNCLAGPKPSASITPHVGSPPESDRRADHD